FEEVLLFSREEVRSGNAQLFGFDVLQTKDRFSVRKPARTTVAFGRIVHSLNEKLRAASLNINLEEPSARWFARRLFHTRHQKRITVRRPIEAEAPNLEALTWQLALLAGLKGLNHDCSSAKSKPGRLIDNVSK